LFVAANNIAGGHRTRFSVVRYGNVVGSRGSVVPFFRKLIADGATDLPVTHPAMTRFWITLAARRGFRADQLRAHAGRRDLRAQDSLHADRRSGPKRCCRNGGWKIVGIRPGEKLHEVMCPVDDSYHTLEFSRPLS
jgi:UDP-N-acetylglucosamine 4,6-dehydratase